jgi:DNA polymerase III delta prime subunit
MTDSFLSKYRPKTIKDFQLSEHMENAIFSFIEMENVNLLLYGNTSSGKSMLLNAIVREYYNLAPDAHLPENNILTINNLKEQGIQYYRNEMKSFCQTHSIIHGKKKMVIIDDIDNVNEQSQQVFRNYMDKYKHNVHFVAVCTNMQKVIESIQSRMHIMQLHPLDMTRIREQMETIIKLENMHIPEDSKTYLLSICNNSIRTIINHIEKLYILDKPITTELCKIVCSNISFQHFDEYIDAFKERNLQKGIRILYELFNSGYSVIDILDYFFHFVKSTNRLEESLKYKIIPLLCKYITIFHNVHEDVIELALFTNSFFQEDFSRIEK